MTSPGRGHQLVIDPVQAALDGFAPFYATAATEVPIPLERVVTFDTPRQIVLVAAGAVDLFAVEQVDGDIQGRWTFLTRLERGTILPGTPPGPRHLIIGRPVLGTVLVELAIPALLALVAEKDRHRHDLDTRQAIDQLVRGVEMGITSLSGALRDGLPPREFVALAASGRTEVPDGAVARSINGVQWVEVSGGVAELADGISGTISPGTEVCVTALDWLTVTGDTVLTARSARDLLDEGVLWSQTVIAIGRLLYAVDRRVERRRAQETDALAQRRTRDQDSSRDAAAIFDSVLRDSETRIKLADVSGDSPALAAARLVASRAHFRVRAPLPGTGGGRASTELQTIAAASNVRMRTIRLDGTWWRRDLGPLIGIRKIGSKPVALLPDRGRYVMVDDGQVTGIDRKSADRLRNEATVLYRPLSQNVRDVRTLLRFGLRNNGRDLRTFFSTALLVAAVGLVVPILTGKILGEFVPRAQRTLIVEGSLVVIGSAVVVALLSVVQNIAALRIESRTTEAMQVGVWTRLLSLPASFFGRYSAGELGTKVLGVNSAQELLTGVTTTAALGLLTGLANLVLVFFLNIWLALLATGLVVVGTGFALVVGSLEIRWQRRLYDYEQDMSARVFQILSAMPKLRVAAAEGRVFRLWAREFARGRTLSAGARRCQNAVTTFNAGFPVISAAIIFLVVALPLDHDVSIATFLSFFSAFNLLLAASLQFTSTAVTALGVVPMLEELQPILDAEPEVDELQADPGELSGQVSLSHVSFQYGADSPLVLDDISFDIQPGEFVALVGPSGSGKSTVLRLLLGFESPTSGTVFFDGQPLAELQISAVRRQCGAVLQKGALLAASIKSNIIGSSSYTMDDAWTAAEMAGIAKDIKALPMGMNTVLSEGSSTLSGGQRQRLMIARALVSRPRILLLDEATSALDNPTQRIVAEATRKLNASRLVIAHRISTVAEADKIIVLDKGRIVQQGRYADLLADDDGMFAQLARRQMVTVPPTRGAA